MRSLVHRSILLVIAALCLCSAGCEDEGPQSDTDVEGVWTQEAGAPSLDVTVEFVPDGEGFRGCASPGGELSHVPPSIMLSFVLDYAFSMFGVWEDGPRTVGWGFDGTVEGNLMTGTFDLDGATYDASFVRQTRVADGVCT